MISEYNNALIYEEKNIVFHLPTKVFLRLSFRESLALVIHDLPDTFASEWLLGTMNCA